MGGDGRRTVGKVREGKEVAVGAGGSRRDQAGKVWEHLNGQEEVGVKGSRERDLWGARTISRCRPSLLPVLREGMEGDGGGL